MTNESLILGTGSSVGGQAARTRDRRGLLGRIAGEPLLHFAVLGGLLFAADFWLHPPTTTDDHMIVVTAAQRQSLIDNYDEDHQIAPTPEELQKRIDAWVASEILYREGKKLGVDRGDDMIRDRIAYKLQYLIFDQAKVPQPTEAELQAWFDQNHSRFDEPERVGFYLTPATDEATARREFDDIKAGKDAETLRQQTKAILGRAVDSLAPVFGEKFKDALLALPLNQWTVLQSTEGWHVVRLDSRHEGKRATLDEVRDDAARIWHTDEVRKRAWEAVNRLKASYTVKVEP